MTSEPSKGYHLHRDGDQFKHHIHIDAHRYTSWLADVILGGQDGLVNVLGIVLGVAAATQDVRIVTVAGLAATFAESVSMAAVAYTSSLAEAAHYESELEREYRHIRMVPAVEKNEIREIYHQKGFDGELLDQIVEKITADEDVWVGVMMSEEHNLSHTERRDALRTALVVGVAAVVGSLIPLIPFFILPVSISIWLSVVITAVTLFVVGAYKARTTVGNPGKSGLEMAVIGIVSALAGYLVGMLLKVPTSP
jgi:VIT1/CCC1 family predicted Fe2+/Mn2+ transporter